MIPRGDAASDSIRSSDVGSSRPTYKEWALLAVSVCLTLAVAEGVCRVALPRPGFTPLSGDWLPGVIKPHPSRLYQLVPNFSGSITVTGGSFKTISVETDADGLRERPLENLRRSGLRILAVGDSFTFGTGIERIQTWPAQLERALLQLSPRSSIAVANAGVPGYGLAQIRDLTEELLPKLLPQVVILGVYAGGFDRLRNPYTAFGDIIIRKSEVDRVRKVKGGLVRSQMNEPSAIALDLWLEEISYAGALVFHGAYKLWGRASARLNIDSHSLPITLQQHDASAELAEGLVEIRRIHKLTSKFGIPLVVLLITNFHEDNRVDETEKFTKTAVEQFDSQERIRTFDPTAKLLMSGVPLRVNAEDSHWSAPANAIVAQELASYLIGQHVVHVSTGESGR